MPGKRKQYAIKFPPEVIKEAHSTFYRSLKKDKKLIGTDFNIWFKDNTILRLDSVDEFYTEYGKDIDRASLRYQYRYDGDYSSIVFQLDYTLSRETEIDISSPTPTVLEKAFAVFDKNYKQPESEESATQEQETSVTSRKTRRKAYNFKFSPEVIEKAHRIFSSCLGNDFILFESKLKITTKNEALELDNEEQFFTEYRKDIFYAEMNYFYRKRELFSGLLFSLDYSKSSGFTVVHIELSSNEDIEKVLSVLDIVYTEQHQESSPVSSVRASKKDKITEPFILTEERLLKLTQILGGSIEYSVKCQDDLIRKFTTTKEFLQYDNPLNKEVKWIIVTSSLSRPYRLVSFSLSRYGSDSMTIEGSEQEVIQLSVTIKEWLDSLRPWYAPISKLNLSMKMLALFLSLLLFLIGHNPTELATVEGGIWIAAVATGIFIISHILDYGREYFFPIGVFAIGQGAKRYEEQEKIRWGVVIALIISLVASLIWSISSNLFYF